MANEIKKTPKFELWVTYTYPSLEPSYNKAIFTVYWFLGGERPGFTIPNWGTASS